MYIDQALERFVNSDFFTSYTKLGYFYTDRPENLRPHRQAFFFEEALFLNYVIDNWSFDINKLSKYEQKDYLIAVEKLKEWNKVRVFMRDIEVFLGEVKKVTYTRKTYRFPAGVHLNNFPDFEFSITDRYMKILKQLEPYPHWAEKFRKEAEPKIKLMSDSFPISSKKLHDEIYKDFDLHKYFR